MIFCHKGHFNYFKVVRLLGLCFNNLFIESLLKELLLLGFLIIAPVYRKEMEHCFCDWCVVIKLVELYIREVDTWCQCSSIRQ